MARALKEAYEAGYVPKEKDIEAIRWCLKNGIRIYIVALYQNAKVDKFAIEIEDKNKTVRSPKEYKAKELNKKIYELYTYYYEKYRK